MPDETGRDDAGRESRQETEAERLDRNWTEILQELRVVQTGTQILTGFLLTVAFQQRFADLDGYEIAIYLALVGFSALATILALTPVSLHRGLFRERAKPALVKVSNRLLKVTLAAVLVTLAGTTLLIFDLVAGPAAGTVAGSSVILLGIVAWFVSPGLVRIRMRSER